MIAEGDSLNQVLCKKGISVAAAMNADINGISMGGGMC